mgnify:CR=1 FL=1
MSEPTNGKKLTDTQLRMEYAERTLSFELPDDIEQAIENDYVTNRSVYTDRILKVIQMIYFIHPEVTPQEMLMHVRRANENS